MLDGLRGEDSIAELCRKEGIAHNLYNRWSKEFREAGKKGWLAIPPEKRPPMRLRHFEPKPVSSKWRGRVTLENRLLKKSVIAAMGRVSNEVLRLEKLEIIRTVETSHLPVRRTLGQDRHPRRQPSMLG